MTKSKSDSRSRHRFGRFAQNYVASESHAKGYDLDRLLEIAQPGSDWKVLDIATGGGHTALKFAPWVERVVASDISPRMLEAAEQHLVGCAIENVTFELADAARLPFQDKRFDLVTCRIAPHHFEDCLRFICHSARVLKGGGLLLVQDHVLPEEEKAARYVDAFERLRDPSHHRAFSESEWRGLFVEAGLQLENVEQVIKRHALIPWVERQGGGAALIERLRTMMDQASQPVRDWMQPKNWSTPEANFANRHVIIAGRKGDHG
jgi:ubiquinone/menaquinone biosynthesis C-methylase UbiE